MKIIFDVHFEFDNVEEMLTFKEKFDKVMEK